MSARDDEFYAALDRAIEAWDVLDVWRDLAGGTAPSRPGIYKSPLREDRSPSFSVFRGKRGGLLWKDHGEGGEAHNAWTFAKLVRPEWDNGQLVDYFFEKSGVPRPEARKLTAAELRERRREAAAETEEARRRVFRERERAVAAVRPVDVSARWSAAEEAAWKEGVAELARDEARALRLAESRGWPVAWVEALADAGHTGVPLDVRGRRNVAFVVERPAMDRCGNLTFEAVGYHQRWYHAATGRKMWSYKPKGVEAYPFFLGWRAEPDVVILTEGQWDAATVWGALGGWSDGYGAMDARRVAVAGLRGASGIEPALAALGPWLRRFRPRVMLLADADEAGTRWRSPVWKDRRKPRPVSLVERVAALVDPAPVRVAWLRDKARAGKDFNDWWRERRTSPGALMQWIERMLKDD